jgi:lysyl-tRNA synthetase class 2
MIYGRRCQLAASPGTRVVRGRVVAVEAETFVVRTQERAETLVLRPGTEAPQCGDIVEALVEDRPAMAPTIRIHRLVAPVGNPVGEPGSLFTRLHRDGSHIQKLLLLKAKALGCIRRFFDSHGFVEWQTPRLVVSPGLEVNLQGFETTYLDSRGEARHRYLPTSPEFSLKKALCAGMERIYELCRCFRNGGESGPLHQCEFTMLEWYRAFADYRAIMVDLEQLGWFLAQELGPEVAPSFRGIAVDWRPPWSRRSLKEVFLHYCGIDLERGLKDPDYFRGEAKRLLGEPREGEEDFDTLFFRLSLQFIEPHLGLGKPEILYDYPITMAALAAGKPEEPQVAERFEVYVVGIELANAFTELNDPVEQEARFHQALAEKRRRGFPQVPIDSEFLRELGYGMPPAAGIALGVERLLMALTDTPHISDLFFLPHRWEEDEVDQRLWPLGDTEE